MCHLKTFGSQTRFYTTSKSTEAEREGLESGEVGIQLINNYSRIIVLV